MKYLCMYILKTTKYIYNFISFVEYYILYALVLLEKKLSKTINVS